MGNEARERGMALTGTPGLEPAGDPKATLPSEQVCRLAAMVLG